MDDEKSSIERLRKKLYSRSGKGLGVKKRRRLRELPSDVTNEWEHTTKVSGPPLDKKKALTGILILSALFFVGALALSSFFFFADRNTVSAKNIEIEIQGPATIKGGEELVLQLLITNKNFISIEEVDLLIEYPDGTRSPEDISLELLRSSESLNTIGTGEKVQKTIRAVLFGEEGTNKIIKVTIEYRVKNSNAIFYREQTYEIGLSSAPLSLLVDSIEEISSGQDIEFTVTITSNSDVIIKDALLVVQYPFGFEFQDSSPRSFAKNNVWELGDIKPEEKRVIKIRGKVLGEDEEERVFRFAAGIRSKRDDTKIETAFITALQSLVVKRPFIGVGFAINGNTTSDPLVVRDTRIRADITWINNLLDKIFDAEIEVVLSGAILDERSVAPQSGFYSSSNNTVRWSRETLASLGTLPEGESGVVSFSFLLIQAQKGETFRTPTITFDITIRGKRVSESNVPETVESTIRRTLKIATDLQLVAQAAYSSGPFTNSGPLPPVAEVETTYTIIWTAQNSTNPVGDVTVSATLPSYMRWVGAVSPATAQVEFNSVGGQIRWNIGTLSAHASREIAFQVAFSPSVSQIDSIPLLIHGQTIEGIDTFTTMRVRGTAPGLTTVLAGDAGFLQKDGVVVEE